MPYRYTLIMQTNTTPTDTELASSHVAGWSESHWHESVLNPLEGPFRSLMMKRALMLPITGAIVGYRIANYQILNSSLRPLGASTGKARFPGSPALHTDLPQVSLEFSGSSATGNSNRFACRCIPDVQMVGGEFQPDSNFKAKVSGWNNELAANGWGFIGRSLTALQPKVMSIVNGVMTTSGALEAVLGETIVTLIGVKDVDGTPVVGNFRVEELVGEFQFKLSKMPTNIVVGAVGYARKLTPIFCDYASVTPTRAVVRKVGRPFEQYRGRASKRRTVA